jgi:hypothetical protein
VRGVGWYLLLPLLIYPVFYLWKNKKEKNNGVLIWMFVTLWLWILISSIRAGGDQWDNPRYRVIFLPWMATLAAYALFHAKESKDKWLLRIFIIEGIFLFFFTQWYLARYYGILDKIPFWTMVGIIIGLSALVILTGLIRDKFFVRKK